MFIVFNLTVNRCPPVPVVANALPDSQYTLVEATVHYSCLDGYVFMDGSSTSSTCDGQNWTTLPTGCQGNARTTIFTTKISGFCQPALTRVAMSA